MSYYSFYYWFLEALLFYDNKVFWFIWIHSRSSVLRTTVLMSVFLKLENTGWHWGPGGFFLKGVKPVCGKCFLGICCACPQFYVPLSFPLSTGSSSPPSSPYCVSLCRNTWTTRGQLMAKWISLIASMMRDDGSSGAPLMLTAAVRDAALNHSKNIIKPSPSRTNAAAWLCCSAILNSSLTKKKKKLLMTVNLQL